VAVQTGSGSDNDNRGKRQRLLPPPDGHLPSEVLDEPDENFLNPGVPCQTTTATTTATTTGPNDKTNDMGCDIGNVYEAILDDGYAGSGNESSVGQPTGQS
jgi:hypothetical protein